MAAFALPFVSAEFGIDSGTTAWVVLAYSLPLAALAIPAGRWVDDADVRTVFGVSLAAVGAASVLTALAPVFWVLIAGRALQGLASALYLAVYMPVVADAVREEQRGRAMSYIQMIMSRLRRGVRRVAGVRVRRPVPALVCPRSGRVGVTPWQISVRGRSIGDSVAPAVYSVGWPSVTARSNAETGSVAQSRRV